MERYDRYRDSGVEWIGEIPSNWKILPLKYCYNFKTGFTPDTKQYEYYDPNGYDWATISDLGGSEIRNTETRISQRFVDEFNPVPILKGSLLYSFKLSAGKVAFAGKDLFTNEAIASFLPNNPCLCFLKYSSYLISFAANENIYGAKLLNASLIKNALMVFPPISVQEKIASFLDEKTSVIDSLIQKNEKSIELLQDYRKSVISEAVTKGLDPNVPMKDSGVEWIGEIPEGWSISSLKYLASIKGGSTPSKSNPAFWGGEIPWVSSQEVKLSRLTDTSQHITQEALDYCSNVVFPAETVVMVVRSGILKHTLPVSILDKPMTINQDIKAVQFFRDSQSAFFYYFVKGLNNALLHELCKDGSTVDNLDIDLLSRCPIIQPPIDEQTAIVNYLDQKTSEIDSLIEKKKQLVEKLQEYRKSLISECVTGKVKVPGVE